MTPLEARALLIRRLLHTVELLPNGLLQRLVDDALFFHEWNMKKRRARRSARLAQHDAQLRRADEAYWKGFRQRYRI